MRKALLLLTIAMLLPMAISAQLLQTSEVKVEKAPYALKSLNQRLMAPARVDLAANQRIMGHYDTDDYASDGLGITGLPGVITIGTIITPDELAIFRGGKIVKFRVALSASTTVSRVFVIPVNSQGYVQTTTEWSCSVNRVGWNEISLETPYDIDLAADESLMIGFDYRQTSSNYPISAVTVGDIYPTYIYYQNQWQDVGLDEYGNLGVQCIVENDNFPQYSITVGQLASPLYVKIGERLPYTFFTRNMGIAQEDVAVGACTYDVLVDGEYVQTISNSEPFGFGGVTINSNLAADYAVGEHTLTIRVNTLNGEAVENPSSVSKTFIVYEFGFARQMHILEQFTSTYCTWCPLGIDFLRTMMNMRDGDVAWVGVHGNMNGTDPMRTVQTDSIMAYLGTNSYPTAAFNRTQGWEDDGMVAWGIGYYEQYHQQLAEELSAFFDEMGEAPSFATVNINSTYDPETRKAVITVNGEVTPDFDDVMGADSRLTVYITEDGVVARQLNQGTWVSNFEHNGVLRRAVPSIKGSELNRTGNTYENVVTYTIPAAWNADNLNVVAFINRPIINGASGVYDDVYINQGNKRKLGEYDEPQTSIRGDVDMDGQVTITDVTVLINYLLTQLGDIDEVAADCSLDNAINITDVTELINFLLTGNWRD